MNLQFLPTDILSALGNLNLNFLSEIRLRKGQPVIIEYNGKYKYLSSCGATEKNCTAIICGDVTSILYKAMGGSVYSFAEEIKEGFITVKGGVRIGIAGEYVAENGKIKTIARATSLNIRIPHNVIGCSSYVFDFLLKDRLESLLIFSKPGYGKTTMLRDIVINASRVHKTNILVLDVRNEISGAQCEINLGERVDVVKSCDKLCALKSAVRAMKPELIVTDELYGDSDAEAVKFARDCGIKVIASSHVCEPEILKQMPFNYFVKLNGINLKPEIYDKNFNSVCYYSADDVCRRSDVGGKKEENGCLHRAI